MTSPNLTIKQLLVLGESRPTAAINFTSGLNLVVGASDTGKTFIFEAIDFMLGARGPLRRIPEASGYSIVSLLLDASVSPPVRLERSFLGGDFTAFEFQKGTEGVATSKKSLSATHSKDPNRSLSAYLLRAIGVGGREIRKNASGAKQSLSFRDFCHLALVDEERIIQQASPVLTGHRTSKTAEQSVFAFLLTGTDDSSVVTVETRKERAARLIIQEEVVAALLDEKRAELSSLGLGEMKFAEEADRLHASIEQSTRSIVTSQTEIEVYERRREESLSARARHQARLTFLSEQIQRLRLLQDYYDTDRARLETLVQASRAFHTLPEGSCPFCNRAYDNRTAGSAPHDDLESACSAEMTKIDALRRQLLLAIADMELESDHLQRTVNDLSSDVAQIQSQLDRVLAPSVSKGQATLESLVDARSVVAQAISVQSTIDGLERRLRDIADQRGARPIRQAFEKRTTTSAATELCQVIEDVLTSWKYPNVGRVTYDAEKGDLVIAGQDRANKGKGHRAITYAAFAIGLMRYCRARGIPHPGFVVLDTPLNPFKGPAQKTLDERLPDEVKVAFFESLADDTSGDQVIVMENQEPPADVQNRVTFHRFTKNVEIGRYGFFPV